MVGRQGGREGGGEEGVGEGGTLFPLSPCPLEGSSSSSFPNPQRDWTPIPMSSSVDGRDPALEPRHPRESSWGKESLQKMREAPLPVPPVMQMEAEGRSQMTGGSEGRKESLEARNKHVDPPACSVRERSPPLPSPFPPPSPAPPNPPPRNACLLLPMDYSGMLDELPASSAAPPATSEEFLLSRVDGRSRLGLQARVHKAATPDMFLTLLHRSQSFLNCLHLPPPAAVDVLQAWKDAQRETVVLNGRSFSGDPSGLQSEMHRLVAPLVVDSETATLLCQDILRASSRTASGGEQGLGLPTACDGVRWSRRGS